MSTVKNGQVKWDEPVVDAGKRSKNDFLRLAPGNNELRLLTLPHQYHQHRYEPEGGKKWGYRINCSRSDTEKNCPLCEQGLPAKKRWFVGVIERKTGAYKMLDISYGVFKGIQTLAKSAWGTPDKYDINIVVDPNGGPTGYYGVFPMPASPLSAEELSKQEDPAVLEDLESRTTAPTPERIKERLKKIHDEIEGNDDAPTARGDKKSAPAEEEEDDDDFFSNYKKDKAKAS